MTNEQLEKFLSTATPYHFTIHNECNELATATINLESLNAGEEKQLEDQYINAILYETDYHNNLNSVKQLIASIYNDENKVLEDSLHAYKLYNFTLQKGETKSFNLQLYMDSQTPRAEANMNASWKGKITLSAEYKEMPTANLSGKKVSIVESGDGLYAVSHEELEELVAEWNKIEYRYAGADPDNYVEFNNEIWRIIGLVNVKTATGVEQRIKIVRTNGIKEQKSIGNYYFDISSNIWTTSMLNDLLNDIYYKSEIGTCFTSEISSECDFNTGTDLPKGLDETARNMIDKEVIWNLGGWTNSEITAKQFYEKERGATVNGYDTPTEWSNNTDNSHHNGIGLIYPSDYGYAVGGTDRKSCLMKNLYNYSENNCNISNWLKPSSNLWTLSPYNSYYNSTTFIVNSSGDINFDYTSSTYEVYPVVYLTTSTKILDGNGTIDEPYQLQIVS